MSETFALNIFRKAGGLRSQLGRTGTVYHAVECDYMDGGPALCGDSPAVMWDADEGKQVTCKYCLKLLERRSK